MATSGMRTVIYPVNDLAAAKRIYGALFALEPTMDAEYYVGYDVDQQHVGLDHNGHRKGMTGLVGYWHVDDIAVSLKALVDAGGEVRQDINDVGGGRLIATVADAGGNVLGLLQP